jgi:thiamine-phosphate pyrophosphorylase
MTPIPIIAVGGITIADVTELLKAGVSGLAVSAAITRDFDCVKTFNQLSNLLRRRNRWNDLLI